MRNNVIRRSQASGFGAGVDDNINRHCSDVVVILDNRQAPHNCSITGCGKLKNKQTGDATYEIQLEIVSLQL
jgi:hypothetical protein